MSNITCLKIKMFFFLKSVLLSGVCHQELKGMLCDTFPYEFVSFLALVMSFWSLTCRKFSTRVGVRGYYRDTQKLKFDQGWS